MKKLARCITRQLSRIDGNINRVGYHFRDAGIKRYFSSRFLEKNESFAVKVKTNYQWCVNIAIFLKNVRLS